MIDPLVIVMVLAIGAMFFLSSRTRKQQQAQADFRANLQPGQEVMTASGVFGTVVEVDEDSVTIETTPGVKIRWIRAAIAKLVEPPVDEDEDGSLAAGDGSGASVAPPLDGVNPQVPDDLRSIIDPKDGKSA